MMAHERATVIAGMVIGALLLLAMPVLAQQDDVPADPAEEPRLEGMEVVQVFFAFLWTVQVPIALYMRMDALQRGLNGNMWFVLGATPVVGPFFGMAYLWVRRIHPPIALADGTRRRRSERSIQGGST